MLGVDDMLLIGGTLGLLNGAMGLGGMFTSAKTSYKYSKKLQEDAQRHQIHMFQNAHQWEVNDLRNAGLNPILSANSGTSAGSSPLSHTSVPGVDTPDLSNILSELQGFSSARDAQKFARENHEVDLATKEAGLAQLEANYEKTLAEIDAINTSSALDDQLLEARNNEVWRELQTISPIISTFGGGNSAFSVSNASKSSGKSSSKNVLNGLLKSANLDPESVFSGVGRLHYINKYYKDKHSSENAFKVEKKYSEKQPFTRYKYKYHNK